MKFRQTVTLVLSCVFTCFGQHGPQIQPIPCTKPCGPVSCPGAYTPAGECCPICPNTGYPSSRTKGSGCSGVRCPDLGDCYNPYLPPGECCKKCGIDCRAAFCPAGPTGCVTYIPPGKCCLECKPRTCVHNGKVLQEGDKIKIDCNTCTCTNGQLACNEIACVDKPGQCPTPTGPSHCAILCSHDTECPGKQKCCNIGCGIDCVDPVYEPPGPDCINPILCAAVPANCRDIITPPGQCCPTCASTAGY